MLFEPLQVTNSKGQTALALATNEGYYSIANLIREFVQTPTTPPKPSKTNTGLPGPQRAEEKKKTLFMSFGPKMVLGGDSICLRIYCIDNTDNTLRETVSQTEAQMNNVPWAAPNFCLVPAGENIEFVIQQSSDIISLKEESSKGQIDANWIGMTSVDFEFDVGIPPKECKVEAFFRASCKGTPLTDIKMKYKVNPGVYCIDMLITIILDLVRAYLHIIIYISTKSVFNSVPQEYYYNEYYII